MHRLRLHLLRSWRILISWIWSRLIKLAGDKDVHLVGETKNVQYWAPRTKTSVAVKDALEGRGWRWASARVEGVKRKVIFLPRVEQQPSQAQQRNSNLVAPSLKSQICVAAVLILSIQANGRMKRRWLCAWPTA